MKKPTIKWKKISAKTVFRKYGRGIEKIRYRLPDDKEADFYIKKEKAVVSIVPFIHNNNIILVKQFRPGVGKILLELPGGGIERGETVREAAERELFEETGYKGKLRLLTYCYDCAYSTMLRYCFVATDCKKFGKQKLDKKEFVEVVLIPLREFRQLLRSGKMTDVEVGYLGLDYLGLL